MNSLQIGLIGIGVIVVAILFMWHWWQTRAPREKPVALRTTEAKDQVVTLDDGDEVRVVNGDRHEPQPEPPAPDTAMASQQSTSGERQEPVWAAADDMEDGVVGEPVVRRTTADHQADDFDHATKVTTHVTTNQSAEAARVVNVPVAPPVAAARTEVHDEISVPGSTNATALPDVLKKEAALPFDERLHAHAVVQGISNQPFDAAPLVNAAGRAMAWVRLFRHSPWESFDPLHVGSVQQLVLALPLASRGGAIAPQDLIAWREQIKTHATTQQCEAQFHGLQDADVRAAQLDEFLVAVDVIPVVYLVKRDGSAWPGTRLRGTLEANGFRLQSDGRFAYYEVESDAVIFYAKDGYETPFTSERLRSDHFSALCCSLEPVRLERPMVRFDSFRQTLRALAKLLDAELKNSEGDTLGETEFAAMREEVKAAMGALSDAGIEPGSDTALSLFS